MAFLFFNSISKITIGFNTRKIGARCRTMTCSLVIGRNVWDIFFQDFRLWISFLNFRVFFN
jgi:hypothetical protein